MFATCQRFGDFFFGKGFDVTHVIKINIPTRSNLYHLDAVYKVDVNCVITLVEINTW